MIQYSGADTGYMFLKVRSDFILKAEFSTMDEDVHIVHEHPDADKFPLALLKYAVRLKELLVIDKPFILTVELWFVFVMVNIGKISYDANVVLVVQ